MHLAADTADTVASPTTQTRTWWWGFAAYAVIALAHVILLAAGSPLTYPSKLALMPALILAAAWALRGTRWGVPHALLVAALVFSWFGDGAAFFFPFFDDELPMMLLSFGLAHACYIVLFWGHLAVRRLPWWSAIYAVWWVVLIIVLWPLLGALAIGVAVYGLVLGGTAAAATRCNPAVIVGAVFFLASDTTLAFRLFVPGTPDWAGVAVMVTYTIGQGLIALGVVQHLRGVRAR
ncbi:lysoplasmalogenase [Microbacterium sp. zg.Y625]|uniref:lysoplasmalogenase n=1 Tax=Microbacterium jiangjiandongii TaxID=3049071 RepID=UPI00214B17B1|nr:lysoplasmalogenase [Microbacterium sp. zg.Y625]MCR2792369.1 lysoplasmalogenase [Microbacterium sp. zg.Y625]